ncbi:MAG TPA: 30S ribosomal protein S17e [Candidatus Pacearchaeota archaeon]|nr:30S ribosomal protein S17e [Candidatus Pacearchaeota archaeon]
MGKIKSKMVRRAANEMVKQGIGFSEDFERNKKVLGNKMPSKKIRNQLAGHISKIKREEKKE